eukprot:Rhum_TRINITY_DN14519_c4_g1::Rhum_TRINITY_DN14519_c4_g1_i1::g.95129::m.95129
MQKKKTHPVNLVHRYVTRHQQQTNKPPPPALLPPSLSNQTGRDECCVPRPPLPLSRPNPNPVMYPVSQSYFQRRTTLSSSVLSPFPQSRTRFSSFSVQAASSAFPETLSRRRCLCFSIPLPPQPPPSECFHYPPPPHAVTLVPKSTGKKTPLLYLAKIRISASLSAIPTLPTPPLRRRRRRGNPTEYKQQLHPPPLQDGPSMNETSTHYCYNTPLLSLPLIFPLFLLFLSVPLSHSLTHSHSPFPLPPLLPTTITTTTPPPISAELHSKGNKKSYAVVQLYPTPNPIPLLPPPFPVLPSFPSPHHHPNMNDGTWCIFLLFPPPLFFFFLHTPLSVCFSLLSLTFIRRQFTLLLPLSLSLSSPSRAHVAPPFVLLL